MIWKIRFLYSKTTQWSILSRLLSFLNETRTGFEERNFSTYPVLHILTHLLRSRNLEDKLFCWWRVKEPLALVMKVCWTWMIGLRTWRSRKWALQTPWNENAMNYNYFLYWKLYLWYFFYEWNVIYTYVKKTFFSSTKKQPTFSDIGLYFEDFSSRPLIKGKKNT